MSEYAIDTVRRAPTRVRALGEAVPLYRLGATDAKKTSGEKSVAQVEKTVSEMLAERRDQAELTTRCAVDGCGWTFTGPAGECRNRAAAHRADAHPQLRQRSRAGGRGGVWRRNKDVDAATVAESRRLRQEKDDAARLATIERGRRARGELLEETAPTGDAAAVSSSSTTLAAAHRGTPATAAASTTTTGRAPMEDKRAQKPRGYWTLETIAEAFREHHRRTGRAPKSSELNGANGPVPDYLPAWTVVRRVCGYDAALEAAGLERPAKASNVGTRTKRLRSEARKTRRTPPVQEKPVQPDLPAGDGGSLAELAARLEQARADLEAATHRYADAVRAFKAHDVIRTIANEEDIAA